MICIAQGVSPGYNGHHPIVSLKERHSINPQNHNRTLCHPFRAILVVGENLPDPGLTPWAITPRLSALILQSYNRPYLALSAIVRQRTSVFAYCFLYTHNRTIAAEIIIKMVRRLLPFPVSVSLFCRILLFSFSPDILS